MRRMAQHGGRLNSLNLTLLKTLKSLTDKTAAREDSRTSTFTSETTKTTPRTLLATMNCNQAQESTTVKD